MGVDGDGGNGCVHLVSVKDVIGVLYVEVQVYIIKRVSTIRADNCNRIENERFGVTSLPGKIQESWTGNF